MNNYFTYRQAIIDLHERGFCQDFVLFGNDLLWIQKKDFIKSCDFSIVECHQFGHPAGRDEDLMVFAITIIVNNVKGILMNPYSYTPQMPTIITKKLVEMNFHSLKRAAL